MYSRTEPNQTSGYGGDAFSEEQEHKGKIFSVGLPHHDLWMEEEGLAAAVGVCFLTLPPHPQWTREKRCERLKAQQQMTDFATLWEEARCGYQKDPNGTSMTSTA